MKRIISLSLFVAFVLSLFCLSACSDKIEKLEPSVLKSFPRENSPAQVIKNDNGWVVLFNTYGTSEYSIAVGEKLDSLNEIYSVDDVDIWYLDASENAIVWSERRDESITYKFYDLKSQKVETLLDVNNEKRYQTMNVGIYLDNIYYSVVDIENKEVCVYAYNIDLKETKIVYKEEYIEANLPYSINLEDKYLNFVSSEKIKVIDLQINQVAFEESLPENVVYVFTASYDRINDTCAVYYADEDSEDIGIIKSGEGKLFSHITFAENHYAYQEKIECHNGHLYLVFQANVSGNIEDHYQFVDYNYFEYVPVETERAFSFYRGKDGLYSLRFKLNEKDSLDVDLCQY